MTADHDQAADARCAGTAALAVALRDTRARTLATFAAYEDALRERGMTVPYSLELNPPLWELGHVGWFQEWWLRRNPQRGRGCAADPDPPRPPPRRAGADAWFDSGRVPHAERWALPLPSAQALRDDLGAGLGESLDLLRGSAEHDDALYFFRLALLHEDMHHEAAIYMAQNLGLSLSAWTPRAHAPAEVLRVEAGVHVTGLAGPGFVFDNELGRHEVELRRLRIDSAPVTWARYLEFVAADGYERPDLWSDAGRVWLRAQTLRAPRYLRERGGVWQRWTFGRWIDLDPALPAMNLTAFEAQAYCAWAGARLPSEAEWERAAESAGAAWQWGQVWEWTASAFAPYPGFAAHPYRDYSQPWFHTRQVLRGGSFATHARMRHPRYRNFFMPGRNDVFAGFRTCALQG
ncbi:MAG TPA: selenoneine synthase SenA [Burkholderiaceae bacterium]|nr:selenoneine synthase SenA [Burkholderiaceae bacterium]